RPRVGGQAWLEVWWACADCSRDCASRLDGAYAHSSFGGSACTCWSAWTANRGSIPVYGLRRKADTLALVKRFVADVSYIGAPACFRTDNGGEFTSKGIR
ncbi:unnamed protein product, partial [Pylaiella littoralis]